jgi:FtsP/CotA-like multicopper oxidase with cupredoxin domain
MGALIIEDKQLSDGVPDEIFAMPTLVVTIQHFDVWDLRSTAELSDDVLFNLQFLDSIDLYDFYLVNGDLQPTITVNANEWTRFRVVHTSPTRSGIISFQNCECELYLLAKDGVYLPRVPRRVSQLFFTVSSRVDFALRCSTIAVCNLVMNDVDIATLNVVDLPHNTEQEHSQFPCWIPCFPDYLMDLRDFALEATRETVTNTMNIEMGMSAINGYQFSGFSSILGQLPLNSIQQWDLVNTAEHPLHFHIHHFQIISEIESEEVEGWTNPGDWIDTLANSQVVTIRFRPLDFVGYMLIHCHIPSHADQGAAALFQIVEDSNHTEQTHRARQHCGLQECLFTA